MKKVLLGTTALVAASIVAGGVAQAQEEPIQLGLGGYYRAALGVTDQDDSGNPNDNAQATTVQNGADDHSVSLAQDLELTISGSTTLDNGLTAGISAQIEGNSGDETGSASLDERFLFFRGSFGQIRVGSTESARQEFTNFAPSGAYNFGVNTPFFIFSDVGNAAGVFNVRTYDDGLAFEDGLKILYFSPTFNGFRLGLSYQPDDALSGAYGGNSSQDAGELMDAWSAAAEFANDFGDFNVRVAAGYEEYVLERCGTTAGANNCTDDPASWHAGATIGFGMISFGGGYLHGDQVARTTAAGLTLGSGMERDDWDLGLSYWNGPWGAGLMWGHAEIDQADATTDELDIYELNGTYVLGPGIDVEATVRFGEFDDGTPGVVTIDNDFTEFAIGTALTF